MLHRVGINRIGHTELGPLVLHDCRVNALAELCQRVEFESPIDFGAYGLYFAMLL